MRVYLKQTKYLYKGICYIIKYFTEIFYLMLKQLDEIQLSQDVNIVLTILKRTIATFQIILMQETKYQKVVELIYKSSDEIKYLLDIAKRYKNVITHNTYKLPFNTMQKLKTKIKDMIFAVRDKFNNGNSLRKIKGFLQEIQNGICVYEKRQDLTQIVQKIYNTISNQLRTFIVRNDLFHRKNHNSNLPPLEIKNQKLLVHTPVQMINLTSLFNLQIDYSSFRASISQCKKNQLQFIQEQLQRNKIASKEIQNFMKDFYLHMNKYVKKRKSFSQLQAKNTNKNIKDSYKNMRVKSTLKIHQHFNNQRPFKQESCKQNKERISSSNKLVFKINRVYVSGSQFNKYSDNRRKFTKTDQSNKKCSILLTQGIRDPLSSKFNNINNDSIFTR